jgi:hypothetical protein
MNYKRRLLLFALAMFGSSTLATSSVFTIAFVSQNRGSNQPSIFSRGLTTEKSDCGCSSVEFSGEPSSRAQTLNTRQALSGQFVYNAQGERVSMDSLVPTSGQPVITVFLRSLG